MPPAAVGLIIDEISSVKMPSSLLDL